jgi:hypothetical protein
MKSFVSLQHAILLGEHNLESTRQLTKYLIDITGKVSIKMSEILLGIVIRAKKVKKKQKTTKPEMEPTTVPPSTWMFLID